MLALRSDEQGLRPEDEGWAFPSWPPFEKTDVMESFLIPHKIHMCSAAVQFGGQAPRSSQGEREFAYKKFGIEFPVMVDDQP